MVRPFIYEHSSLTGEFYHTTHSHILDGRALDLNTTGRGFNSRAGLVNLRTAPGSKLFADTLSLFNPEHAHLNR